MSEPATIAAALRVLARDIVCEDGVATLCLHEAANEIDRLAAQVGRLRMTPQERDAIEAGAHALNQVSATARPDDRYSARGVPGSFRLLKQAAALRGFLDRHARETVGG